MWLASLVGAEVTTPTKDVHQIAQATLKGLGHTDSLPWPGDTEAWAKTAYRAALDQGMGLGERYLIAGVPGVGLTVVNATALLDGAAPDRHGTGVSLRGACLALGILASWRRTPHVYIVDDTLARAVWESAPKFPHDGVARCPAPAAMVFLNRPGQGLLVPFVLARDLPSHVALMAPGYITLAGSGLQGQDRPGHTMGQLSAALFSALADAKIVEAAPSRRTRKQRRRDAKVTNPPRVEVLRVRVPELRREVVRGEDGPAGAPSGRKVPGLHLVLPHAHNYWVGSGTDRRLEPRWVEAYWKGTGDVQPSIKLAKGIES